MVDEEKDKEPEKVEKKDDRPDCVYCGGKIDHDLKDKLPVKDRMPVPKRQWLLIGNEQNRINNANVQVEKANLKLSDKVNEFAKNHGLTMHPNFQVLMHASEEDKEHEHEFYILDAVTREPKYLGRKLNEKQVAEIKRLMWAIGDAAQAVAMARSNYNETIVKVAATCEWFFAPIITERGNFMAPDLLKDAVDRAKEKWDEDQKKKEEQACKA